MKILLGLGKDINVNWIWCHSDIDCENDAMIVLFVILGFNSFQKSKYAIVLEWELEKYSRCYDKKNDG